MSPNQAQASNTLSLRGFGVAFGERVILSDVTLDVPERGVTVLMGPAGTGKSTLLRTLAGFNAANPSHRWWGDATYAGTPLGDGERPAMVTQSARLMMAGVLENLVHDLPERHTLTLLQQRDLARRLLHHAGLDDLAGRLERAVVKLPLGVQRHLAILRLAAASPRLLCLDEPTSGLEPSECEPILEYIAKESRRRAILIVLHNQEHADRLGGHTALLAGGRIQEHRATEHFFVDPRSEPAREFVRSGCCVVPSPGAKPEELDAGVPVPPPLPAEARAYVSDSFGPRGFLWMKKGMLAGTPRPGVVRDIDYDLSALKRVGVTTLVSLTRNPVDPKLLGDYGIDGIWSPITDMEAPTVRQAVELCRQMQGLMADGKVVAVHCRAGLGRTGTVLAAYLIWEGRSALDALESVRCIEPRWVQSEAQVEFLEAFARSLANSRARQHRAHASTARTRADQSVPSN
ncbi:ABC transporter [Sulfurifustis variabilis]|uniref:ABC transporter n=1 Tax=Sulfurifustis variabilis TaxID=1675686 RepID=A0A1B4V4C8_9GAMM|nr:ATP-binding cassette domain-containing protein [Sulfurifustis variabilis]BAU48388.1 ABC transporter [Sulfurifustis variabilis]